jgi:hypothetical protein
LAYIKNDNFSPKSEIKHNIGFHEKRQFLAKNWAKLKTIITITLTPRSFVKKQPKLYQINFVSKFPNIVELASRLKIDFLRYVFVLKKHMAKSSRTAVKEEQQGVHRHR